MKKLVSLIIALAMIITVLPLGVMADGEEAPDPVFTLDISNNTVKNGVDDTLVEVSGSPLFKTNELGTPYIEFENSDGTERTSSYIKVENSIGLVNGLNEVTVEVWALSNSASNPQEGILVAFSRPQATPSPRDSFRVYAKSTKMIYDPLGPSREGTIRADIEDVSGYLNKWTHYVFTRKYDEATGEWTAELYANGELKGTETCTWARPTDQTFEYYHRLFIGGIQGEGVLSYRGGIAETNVYNAILTPEQIAAKYEASKDRYVDPEQIVIPDAAFTMDLSGYKADGRVLDSAKGATVYVLGSPLLKTENGINYLEFESADGSERADTALYVDNYGLGSGQNALTFEAWAKSTGFLSTDATYEEGMLFGLVRHTADGTRSIFNATARHYNGVDAMAVYPLGPHVPSADLFGHKFELAPEIDGNLNKWTHYVFTRAYDESTHMWTAKVYANGVKVSEKEYEYEYNKSGTDYLKDVGQRVFIGGSCTKVDGSVVGTGSFKGGIAEANVYQTILTDAQIAKLYNTSSRKYKNEKPFLSDIVLTSSGQGYEASATLNNWTGEKPGCIYGVYKNKQLLNLYVLSDVSQVGGSWEIKSEILEKDFDTVKLFVWKKDSMIPIVGSSTYELENRPVGDASVVDILLVAGQSNALGQGGDASQSIRPDKNTVYYNTMGNTMLSDSGNIGWDAALGKRWHELTGHTVLIVKAAWGGTGFPTKPNVDTGEISTAGSDRYGWWNPDNTGSMTATPNNCYAMAKQLYNTAVQSITDDYTIGDCIYFWNQGENENTSYTAAEYEEAFLELHNKFKTEFGTAETRLQYGGILPVRSPYASGFPNLKLTGPRIAQYKMAREHNDIMIAMDATEHWYSDTAIESWFTSEYNGKTYPLSDMPDAWGDIMNNDRVHYKQAAMNEFGIEAAENMLAYIANAENTNTLSGIDLITPAGIVHYNEGDDIILPQISADNYNHTTEGVIPVVPASSGVRATFALTGDAAYMDANGVITANETLQGDYSTLTVSVDGEVAMTFKVYSPLVDNSVSIATVKDNKRGIYTLTTDDNYRYTNYVYLDAKIRELGLKATMGLVVDWMNDESNTNPSTLTWEEAQELVDNGHWGVASHTMNHKSTFANLTEAQLNEEINGARIVFKEKFPSEKIVGLYTPSGISSDLIRSVVAKEHLCLRLADGGLNLLPMTESGMYKLSSYGVHGKDAATLNALVDTAISDGKWLVEMWHGVGDTDAASWSGNITEANANAHLEYIASKKDDLWITTLDEASIYAMHRLNAKLSLKSKTDDEITFTLTDEFPRDIYGDSALTLNITLPDGWSAATITHGGEDISINENSDGSISVTVGANGGDIVVSKA